MESSQNSSSSIYFEVSNVTDIDTLHRNLSETVIGVLVLVLIIVSAVIGNILVIMAIFTYRPLRKTPNLFLISLAVADLSVVLLVVPLHLVQFVLNRWVLGIELCKVWLTLDILLCTASILNLCAVAMDRYCAIKDPVSYAPRRSVGFVLCVIAAVWIVSTLVSVPPLMGWNNWDMSEILLKKGNDINCQYTDEQGFVIYSALGSFYVPLVLMSIVYSQIYLIARKRIKAQGSRSAFVVFKDQNFARNQLAIPGSRALAKKSISMQHLNIPAVLAQANSSSMVLRNANSARQQRRNSGIGDNDPQKCARNTTKRLSEMLPQVIFKRKCSLDEDSDNADNQSVIGPLPSDRSDRSGNRPLLEESPQLNDRSPRPSLAPDGSVQGAEHLSQYFHQREKISLSRERKAAKVLAIIISSFVLCWLPFFLIYVINSFLKNKIHPKIFEAANWLGYINSVMNPCIYTIFNTDFRMAFRKILRRSCGCFTRP